MFGRRKVFVMISLGFRFLGEGSGFRSGCDLFSVFDYFIRVGV